MRSNKALGSNDKDFHFFTAKYEYILPGILVSSIKSAGSNINFLYSQKNQFILPIKPTFLTILCLQIFLALHVAIDEIFLLIQGSS